eukprot:1889268-Rhodomonas_salina.1
MRSTSRQSASAIPGIVANESTMGLALVAICLGITWIPSLALTSVETKTPATINLAGPTAQQRLSVQVREKAQLRLLEVLDDAILDLADQSMETRAQEGGTSMGTFSPALSLLVKTCVLFTVSFAFNLWWLSPATNRLSERLLE